MNSVDNFEGLIEEYHPIIYKICRVYAEDDDFKDLYQEILINLWKSYKSFEGRSKLSTWLYQVALNTALTYQRNAKRYKARIAASRMPALPEEEPHWSEKEQQIAMLYKAIAMLKKDDRSLILLYLEEKPYEEIAEILGLTISNVGVKINRLKKKLFQFLNELKNEGSGSL